MNRLVAAILIALVLASGCLSAEIDPRDGVGLGQAPTPIVIAIMDSGLTPYSGSFDTHDDELFAQAIPVPFTRVTFPARNGSDDAPARDQELWDQLRPDELYHFGGTRLFGISVDPERTTPYNLDVFNHGAAVSHLASREAPNAAILVVQVGDSACSPPVSCLAPPSFATGMEWIADQPWIDVVSVSVVYPANAPDRPEVHADMARYLAATQLAASRGKLIVQAAGNTVTPTLSSYFSGPPHIIAAGGYAFNRSGESLLASKGVDAVANFTEWVPNGRGIFSEGSGTSYATPIVAGTLANALAQIRAADTTRQTTTEELRDGLNATALMFPPTGWKPSAPPPDPGAILGHLSIPAATQPQMGWGYVNGSLAPEIARRVLEQDFSIPAGKAQAAAFQPAWQQAREEYWGAYA